MANKGEQCTGGRGGIRTHGTLAGTPVFKTGALNHSATLPSLRHQSLGGGKIKNGVVIYAKSGPPSELTENSCQRCDHSRFGSALHGRPRKR
jgi:hypothetical protein